MHWPPDIAGDLPAPRDDEPSSLRQDIADELSDHLQCSFTREMHLARDEEVARENTLHRFGDPRAIARKLWFDALRENIMSQRMTFVALVVVLLASLGSSGATWFLIQQAQKANDAMLVGAREANEAMLAQNRDATAEILTQSREANKTLVELNQQANAALIEKLGQLPKGGLNASEPTPSLEWNPVKVRLFSGQKPGVPAAGFTIALVGHVLDTSKAVTISRTTDETGLADFGLVRPGQHFLHISAPWDEKPNDLPLNVLPGKAVSEEIPCPAADLPNAKLRLEVDWPEDLKARGCWLVCQFVQVPRTLGGRNWTRPVRDANHFVLLGPESQLVAFPFGTNRDLISTDLRQTFQSWPFQRAGNGPYDVRGLYADHFDHTSAVYRKLVSQSRQSTSPSPLQVADPFDFVFGNTPPNPHLEIAAFEWRLESLLICDKPHDISLDDAWKVRTRRFGRRSAVPMENLDPESRVNLSTAHLLGGLLPNGGSLDTEMNQMSNDSLSVYRTLEDWVPPSGRNDPQASNEARQRVQPRFVAEAGKTNFWKISLPESLIDRVRNNPDFKPAEPEAKEPESPEKGDAANAAESNGQ